MSNPFDAPRLTNLSIAAQLAQFNREREQQFQRGPTSEERLPLPFTYVGADLPEQPPQR